MFLVYKQVKKYRAEKSQRAAQANADAAPTTIAMPQPQYALNGQAPNGHTYPPSDASTQNPKSQPQFVQHISRTPSPTQSEYDFLNGVKKETTMAQKISQCSLSCPFGRALKKYISHRDLLNPRHHHSGHRTRRKLP